MLRHWLALLDPDPIHATSSCVLSVNGSIQIECRGSKEISAAESHSFFSLVVVDYISLDHILLFLFRCMFCVQLVYKSEWSELLEHFFHFLFILCMFNVVSF